MLVRSCENQQYTWVVKGNVRVKCLAQEHSTVSLARARTRTALSEAERTNHETIVFSTSSCIKCALNGGKELQETTPKANDLPCMIIHKNDSK